jgi:hypothetical protein
MGCAESKEAPILKAQPPASLPLNKLSQHTGDTELQSLTTLSPRQLCTAGLALDSLKDRHTECSCPEGFPCFTHRSTGEASTAQFVEQQEGINSAGTSARLASKEYRVGASRLTEGPDQVIETHIC